MQNDVIAHGQTVIITRELSEITGADLIKYAKEIKQSMANEWTNWNDHHSFIPIQRNKTENTIDARWLHTWKIVDGNKTPSLC